MAEHSSKAPFILQDNCEVFDEASQIESLYPLDYASS
jgi:hypothetical protein